MKFMEEKAEPYKVEFINDLPDAHISFYKQGEFTISAPALSDPPAASRATPQAHRCNAACRWVITGRPSSGYTARPKMTSLCLPPADRRG
ncbi:MAG: hypothetical protein ACLTYN_10925 [Dysosmobacter welbionis]